MNSNQVIIDWEWLIPGLIPSSLLPVSAVPVHPVNVSPVISLHTAMPNQKKMPQEHVSFLVSNYEGHAHLWWSAEFETEVQRFEIEKSGNGQHFIRIGIVQARSQSFNQYQWTDSHGLHGIKYYRLRIRNMDGSFYFSQIQTILAASSETLSFSATDGVDEIVLNHPIALPDTRMMIHSIDGRKMIVESLKIGSTQTSVQVSNLPNGLYLVTYMNGHIKQTIRFIRP